MTILVTGGAGFIGGNFIRFMLKKYPSYRIICYDSLTYAGNPESLADLKDNPSFCFIKGDITDRTTVERVFSENKPDIVVNFAAESHVDRSIDNPSLFITTNVIGTQVLLDAALRYGVRRFHQISTDEVYGDLPLDRPDLLFTESTPLCASSPYSASKASADLLALSYFRTFWLNVTVSRCSNNYGAYQFPEKLIPLMITKALGGHPLPVYGKGENIRDWIHVDDHCRAVDLILHNGREGEIYNIGGGNEKKNIDIVKMICRELSVPETTITHVDDRKGHDLRYAVDSSKISAELSWKPEVDFDEGIKSTIRWYLDNRIWWENILTGKYRTSEIFG